VSADAQPPLAGIEGAPSSKTIDISRFLALYLMNTLI
jgi:hypothetical protein